MYISAAEMYIPAAEIKFKSRRRQLCKATERALQRKFACLFTYVYRDKERDASRENTALSFKCLSVALISQTRMTQINQEKNPRHPLNPRLKNENQL